MGSRGARPVLKFARLSEHAIAPTKGSSFAAGYDLYAAYDASVPPQGKALVKTDIQVAVPRGCYGRVAPRSGLAVKNFVDVGAGVVDEDYRGNLGVVLFNFSSEPFEVKRGDRVAQFICEKIEYPELEECENLDETERGSAGFGSTGVSLSEKEKESVQSEDQPIPEANKTAEKDNLAEVPSPRKRQALGSQN